jgi:hypothetical protein
MSGAAGLMAALVLTSSVSATPFDSAPWLADLEQARQAFHEKYANWDWAEGEHGVNIDALFDQSAARLQNATDQRSAEAVFDGIASKLDDGHVEFHWPERAQRPNAAALQPKPDFCSGIGYEARQSTPGVTERMTGYVPLPSASNPLAAGTLTSGQVKVGILRIGVFQTQGYPLLCQQAARELAIPADRPCDDACSDRISNWAYDRLTLALEDRLRQLNGAGARVLVVDITGNGGGSEWAEAVARILTPKLLVSERRGFVRGEHWASYWRDLRDELHSYAATASGAEKNQLLEWANEADAALADAKTLCPESSTSCQRIAKAGFSTGLVGAAPSDAFAGKKWGRDIFSPTQYRYDEGIWRGPLIVLVDQNTWSAAEEFSALLQDNHAAVILGTRTGGAGCGHTNGGTPTTLVNSHAILELPDCVRFRADGSNEVRGIIPDVLVAIRADDGVAFKASLIAEKLPSAIARAMALHAPAAH